jgi:hypothetical protein
MLNHGWTCPKCSRVHAPSVFACGPCNGARAVSAPHGAVPGCRFCGEVDCQVTHVEFTTGASADLTRSWLGEPGEG